MSVQHSMKYQVWNLQSSPEGLCVARDHMIPRSFISETTYFRSNVFVLRDAPHLEIQTKLRSMETARWESITRKSYHCILCFLSLVHYDKGFWHISTQLHSVIIDTLQGTSILHEKLIKCSTKCIQSVLPWGPRHWFGWVFPGKCLLDPIIIHMNHDAHAPVM